MSSVSVSLATVGSLSEREEMKLKIYYVKTTINRFWQRIGRLISFHIAAIACVILVAPPSKLRCGKVWMAIALLAMVAALDVLTFVMMVKRLLIKYLKMKKMKQVLKELTEPEPESTTRSDPTSEPPFDVVTASEPTPLLTTLLSKWKKRFVHWGGFQLLYALGGSLFFLLFTVSIGVFCWWIACH